MSAIRAPTIISGMRRSWYMKKTRQAQPIRDFTAIIAGMTDIHEAARVDTRVLNESLIF